MTSEEIDNIQYEIQEYIGREHVNSINNIYKIEIIQYESND